MRTIYFNDQTKAFIEKDFDIVFLGNLYLKGKPYTNPKEAVDKEYVDSQWDNITEAQLTKTRFNPKNFPGFNADLINKEGTNNFTLKKVIRAGKYHKVSIDNRGRVVGGRTGKITFDSSDFGGVSFNKLSYDNYKNTNGFYGKPNKIADFTNNLNTNNYLFKSRNTHINRPLRIESGPKTDYNIINEDDIVKLSNKHFIGEVSGVKEKTFTGYGDWGGSVSECYDINFEPWRFQRSFNPYGGILVNDDIKIYVNTSTHVFKGNRPALTNLVVFENKIINLDFRDNYRWMVDLDNNGEIIVESFRKYDFRNIYFTNNTFRSFRINSKPLIINNKLFLPTMFFRESDNKNGGYYLAEYVVDGDEIDFKESKQTSFSGSFVRPLDFIQCGKFRNLLYTTDGTPMSWRIEDGVIKGNTQLTGEKNRIPLTGIDGGLMVSIGGYIYAIPYVNEGKVMARIRLVSDRPSGEWLYYNVDKTVPEGFKVFFASKDHLYYALNNNKNLEIWAFDFNRTNGDISNPRLITSTKINSGGDVSNVIITKSRLYVYGASYLVSFGYKGGSNHYGEESMEGYIPPHP